MGFAKAKKHQSGFDTNEVLIEFSRGLNVLVSRLTRLKHPYDKRGQQPNGKLINIQRQQIIAGE